MLELAEVPAPTPNAGDVLVEIAPSNSSLVRKENAVLLVREIMYCKPGKVKPLVEKFLAMNKLSAKMGMPPMKVMTDLSAERYWTVVSEMEVPSLKAFEEMFSEQVQGQDPDAGKQFEEIMKGYHDLVDKGRREIYKIEE